MGIDFSHFKGQAANKGKAFVGQRQDIQLYLSNQLPIQSHTLKLMLIRDGLKEHRCEVCRRTEWNGKPIPIQLHHCDGNNCNNALNNLQILCANCHAQTETYCSKNRVKVRSQDRPVSDAELASHIPLSENASQVLRAVGLSLSMSHYRRITRVLNANPELRFRKRAIPQQPKSDPYWRIRDRPECRKIVRPSKEDLERLVWIKPTQQLAADLGVSDVVVGKWCARYNISKPPRGYWQRRAAGESHLSALNSKMAAHESVELSTPC
jgi:hypothetical protein